MKPITFARKTVLNFWVIFSDLLLYIFFILEYVIKGGDSETKALVRVEEATRDSLGITLLWLSRTVAGKMCQGEAAVISRKRWRKGGLRDRVRGCLLYTSDAADDNRLV